MRFEYSGGEPQRARFRHYRIWLIGLVFLGISVDLSCEDLAEPSQDSSKPSSMVKQIPQGSTPSIQTEPFDPRPRMSPANGLLARFMLDSPEDLERALRRAEKLHDEGVVSALDQPLAFVIHGPEVEIFFRENYGKYKSIVDLAAKLSAFRVVDVRVCATRMGILGETRAVLPPFVETVPFGPAEVERLIEREDYVYF